VESVRWNPPSWHAPEVAANLDEGLLIRRTTTQLPAPVSSVVSEKPAASMRRRKQIPAMSEHDQELLLKWSKSRTLAARVVVRSRIVLMLARGSAVKAVARELRVAPGTVRLWSKRFRELGPPGLLRDAQGRGRKPTLSHAARQALRAGHGVNEALTVRERARQLGVSASTVSRWRRRND
jgi:transposase